MAQLDPNIHRRNHAISLKKPEPCILMISTHCNWVHRMLRGLRNIYRPKTAPGTICSEGCLREGEERAARMPSPALAFMQKLQPKGRCSGVVDGSVTVQRGVRGRYPAERLLAQCTNCPFHLL